jgi:hypothetical protein
VLAEESMTVSDVLAWSPGLSREAAGELLMELTRAGLLVARRTTP